MFEHYEQIADPIVADIYHKLGVAISNNVKPISKTADAAYSNLDDWIILRPGRTYHGEYDVAVLLHELIHWSKTRVGRKSERTERGYAYEEMVANFGAARLLNRLGFGTEALDAVRGNIRQYVDQWARYEPQSLVEALDRAAQDGTKAADFILSKTGHLPQRKAA